MESNKKQTTKWMGFAGFAALALAAVMVIVKVATNKSAFADSTQTTFRSPGEAATALADAAKSNDETTLERILGVDTKALLSTDDKEADKTALNAFAAKYEKMNRWVDMSDGSRVLYIGADNFPFPVPLAKNSAGQWYFDGVAGAEEVRARDIGRNELLTIDACAALANAQDLYFVTAGSSHVFAQRIVSTPGQKDGLYWPVSAGQEPSPLGDFSEFPKSSLGSNPPREPFVIDGYTLRILGAQGDAAPGGARNYIVGGKMSGGFAILATPVKYAETGVMTFMTDSNGIIYERDLGPDTARIAASVHAFNPTDAWSPVE